MSVEESDKHAQELRDIFDKIRELPEKIKKIKSNRQGRSDSQAEL